MRNLRDSQTFVLELEKILRSSLGTKFSTEVLSRMLPRVFEERFENLIKIKDCSKVNLTVLSILSWYIPEELGVLLRLEIEEKVKNTEMDYLVLLLQSRALCFNFLLDSKLWSARDFFGNILTKKNIEHSLKTIRPSLKSRRKPKKTQRHREYRDKGTLRKTSDKHDLWISTDEHLKLEETRLSNSLTHLFIEGWIT